MRRRLGWIAIAWLLAMAAAALLAYGNPNADTSLAARARGLDSQLRCPACQGESVADSQTLIAQAIRRLVYQRLAAGQSPEQIKSYLVSRFGDRILMAPSQSGIDWLAWLAPPFLLIAGLGLICTLVVAWRSRAIQAERTTAGEAGAGRRQAYLAQVRFELDALAQRQSVENSGEAPLPPAPGARA